MSEGLEPALVQLSVCICTRDRPDDLTKALRSVGESSRPIFQVIVSDDSTDGRTQACVRSSFPWVDFVEGPRRGLSANRNAALAAVRGSHVLFIDDDAVLGTDFLAHIEATLAGIPAKKRDRTIACGIERKYGELVFANDQTFLGHQRRVYREDDERHTIVINATVFPVALFRQVGFDTNLIYGYEEVDIATRAVSVGYPIVLCPEAINDHFPSAVNRDLYQSHVEASRLYVTWKRYAVTQRAYGRAVLFTIFAPAHLVASRLRAEGAGGVRSAFTTVAQAAGHICAYLTSRSDAPAVAC
jgi:GT2 family glycosyltransferase